MIIGIIGCGNMGGAIATSLHKFGYGVIATDHTKEKVLATGASYGSIEQVLNSAEVVILAVKPQMLPALYPTLAKHVGMTWISLAAGITVAQLESALSSKDIVRFMPNVAAKVGQSVTAVVVDEQAKEGTKELALEIAEAFGSAFLLPEKQMEAFIGVSGSGIAYMFQFLHAMALGGTKEGIPYKRSLEIAADTMGSAVALLKASGRNPIDVMTDVCSAGGTTIEGVRTLEAHAFDSAVIEAVTAAAEKSKHF